MIRAKKVKTSPKFNKSEVFFKHNEQETHIDISSGHLAQKSPKKRQSKRLESLPLRDFNNYEGAMQKIDEFKLNSPNSEKKNDRKSKSTLNHTGSLLLGEEYCEFINIKEGKMIQKQISMGGIAPDDKIEIQELLNKIKELTNELKTIPKINKRELKLFSSCIEEQRKLSKVPLEFERSSENENQKHVFIENLNTYEQSSFELEENTEEFFIHPNPERHCKSSVSQNTPLFQKHISYVNEFENLDEENLRHLKFLMESKEMKNVATDTNDLDDIQELKEKEKEKEKEKDKKSTTSIEMQTQETEPNMEEEVKIMTPPVIKIPPKIRRNNTVKLLNLRVFSDGFKG